MYGILSSEYVRIRIMELNKYSHMDTYENVMDKRNTVSWIPTNIYQINERLNLSYEYVVGAYNRNIYKLEKRNAEKAKGRFCMKPKLQQLVSRENLALIVPYLTTMLT